MGARVEDNLEGTEFTFLPHSCFLEFIPEQQISEVNPDTLFLNQVH